MSGGTAGATLFLGGSTAGDGTFNDEGGAASGAFGGTTSFQNTSTAANGNFTNNGGAVSGAFGGAVGFSNTSTAGNATFTNSGGAVSGAFGGSMGFSDASTAGTGTFTNMGGMVSNAQGGMAGFGSTSSAGDATLVAEGGAVSGAFGGQVFFVETSTAANATLIANGSLGGGAGGFIQFESATTGGTARVELFGSGLLSIFYHNLPGITIGSIEGSGLVVLGANNLTGGSNNLSTTFSGTMYGDGGSLTKIGTGTLTLSGVNTYTGGTSIAEGTLVAANDGALGTGDVSLTVSGATLTLQDGPTNNYIADTATLSIVSDSTVDLDFTGTPDRVASLVVDGVKQVLGTYGSAESGAPHQLPEFTGTGEILVIEPGSTPTPTPSPSPSPSPMPLPVQFGNISTRLSVGTDDNVLIGGFIVTGTQAKMVVLRAIGPSLPLTGLLADPTLELHDQTTTIGSNDNWQDSSNKQEIIDSGFAPKNEKESAIVMTLEPGSYTAILRGVNNTTGVALVEVYDLDQTADSKLANISTRGLVQTGDNVMIGGLIVLGDSAANIIVRAIGPSLPLAGTLQDPTLELHDSDGAIIASNDNWRSDQEAEITATMLQPMDDAESAVVMTLNPGAYTAIVRGADDTTGVALVEAYQLDD